MSAISKVDIAASAACAALAFGLVQAKLDIGHSLLIKAQPTKLSRIYYINTDDKLNMTDLFHESLTEEETVAFDGINSPERFAMLVAIPSYRVLSDGEYIYPFSRKPMPQDDDLFNKTPLMPGNDLNKTETKNEILLRENQILKDRIEYKDYNNNILKKRFNFWATISIPILISFSGYLIRKLAVFAAKRLYEKILNSWRKRGAAVAQISQATLPSNIEIDHITDTHTLKSKDGEA